MFKKPKWMNYPEPLSTRTGIKVSWNTYATMTEAEVCSKAAIHNGRIQADLGYDFGYQSPGYIETLPDGNFEVTLP